MVENLINAIGVPTSADTNVPFLVRRGVDIRGQPVELMDSFYEHRGKRLDVRTTRRLNDPEDFHIDAFIGDRPWSCGMSVETTLRGMPHIRFVSFSDPQHININVSVPLTDVNDGEIFIRDGGVIVDLRPDVVARNINGYLVELPLGVPRRLGRQVIKMLDVNHVVTMQERIGSLHGRFYNQQMSFPMPDGDYPYSAIYEAVNFSPPTIAKTLVDLGFWTEMMPGGGKK